MTGIIAEKQFVIKNE